MKNEFREINFREVALFKGEFGWGEFSPFLEYNDSECVPWLACALESATQPRPHLFRNEVSVNGTIPELSDQLEIIKVVESFPGVDTFKIKIGVNLEEDIKRINFVRALKPEAQIRIDANGLLKVPHAEELLGQIGEIEYIEQPCATLAELGELKSRVNVKIAGDEVLRKARDPFGVELNGIVDYLILKVQPLGGIKRAKALAEHHGLPVIISSALESAIGINYGLTLAATFEEMDFDCG